MSVLVRHATAADADDIADLTAQLGYDVDSSLVKDRLSRILLRSDQRFLIADLDGRSVGWLHAVITEYIETGTFVTIGGLVVDRSHRGQGIGRLLMEYAESWARERACPIVRLWSSAGRAEAHRFYEHLGYSNLKTQYSFVKSLEGGAVDMFVPRIR